MPWRPKMLPRARLTRPTPSFSFAPPIMSIMQRLAGLSTAVLAGLIGVGALFGAPAAQAQERTLVEIRESLYNNIYVYRRRHITSA